MTSGIRMILVATALVAAFATAVHETRRAERNVRQARETKSAAATEAGPLAALRRENRALRREFDAARSERRAAPQVEEASGTDIQSEADAWRDRVTQLAQCIQQAPASWIPEMKWLTTGDWLDVARAADFSSEDGCRRAMSALRNRAENRFAATAARAVRKYMDENGDQPPEAVSELAAYFEQPVPGGVLDRWQVLTKKESGFSPDVPVGPWMLVQRDLADPEYDQRFGISDSGTAESDVLDPATPVYHALLNAFRAANPGQKNVDPSRLWPYATTPEQQAMLRRWINRHSAISAWPAASL